MGNGFVGWFSRSYKGIIVGLVAVMTAALVVLAVQHVDASKADAGTAPGPIPTFGTSSAPQKPFLSPSDNSGVTAVFLGDSLTYGLFASAEDKGWRPQVIEALSALGDVDATRAGQTGNTVKAVSDSATIPADADVVFLELGTNDVYKTDIDDFALQYKALTDKVTSSAAGAKIVCLGVWGTADAARNYDAKIRDACTEAGARFVPISQLYATTENRGPAGVDRFGGKSDDFHPNDAGYAAIASAVVDALSIG